jgi:alpha-glucosidase
MALMSAPPERPWWHDAVVYQVYPRSFQDSDGDGEGDLAGIVRRLDHIRDLGADAVWLSPVYPSPMADGGYDVADYEDVDPRFGTLADADALIAAAHAAGLRLLMDVVPCHTSIEHPWFRDHPERYVWSDRDGPPNNWIASFGGAAWSRDARSGRWYLHSFYPEQPDLDWRRQDVRDDVAKALRFWRVRGVDGFRLDAIDRLLKDRQMRDDPPADAPPVLPEHGDAGTLDHVHSRNAPDIGLALAALREAVDDDTLLVGEVYLPAAQLTPYLEHLDCAFAFELLHAPWDAAAFRGAIAAALDPAGAAGRVAWVLSNHDFPRLPDRYGPRNARAAALLALTLPGAVFVYQGDEIGMADGPGRDGIGPPDDRAGRDAHRHPMRWDDDAPHGGFTRAAAGPWLPAIAVDGGGVAQQAADPDSMLALYRALIAARRELEGALEFLDDVADGVLAFRRGGDHVVALNMAGEPRPAPRAGAIVRATRGARHRAGDPAPVRLEPGEGFLART